MFEYESPSLTTERVQAVHPKFYLQVVSIFKGVLSILTQLVFTAWVLNKSPQVSLQFQITRLQNVLTTTMLLDSANQQLEINLTKNLLAE